MRVNKSTPITNEADKACRVCGRVTALTFEHVPPKVVGNKESVELLGFDAWMARENPGEQKPRGTIGQRGSGAHSLCAECNRRAGQLYVPEFARWHDFGARALGEQDLAALDGRMENIWLDVELDDVKPGRFMKQFVTMLLAIAPGGFAEANPELAEYARDPAKVGLASRYRLYLALYAGPVARFDGGMMRVEVGEDGLGAAVHMVELAYPPFAYLLTIDEIEPSIQTCDVTGFTKHGIDDGAEARMTLMLGFGHTIYPGDFRTEAKWKKERAENEAASSD